ncbi:MAG: hypothetical protein WB952_12790 [Terriglobales bacterium]
MHPGRCRSSASLARFTLIGLDALTLLFSSLGLRQGRNTGSVYSFTIDLGIVQNIKELRSRWLQYQSAAILLPAQVAYSLSNDNLNFTLVGTVNKSAACNENLPAWYTLKNLDNVSGRYVKPDVTPPSDV